MIEPFAVDRYKQGLAGKRYEDRYLANITESFSRFLGSARAHGITISAENAGDFSLPFIGRAIEQLVKMDGFSLTWDIGHDATSGYSDRDVLLRHANRVRTHASSRL